MKLDYIKAFTGIQKQQIIDKYGLENGRTQRVIDSAFMGYLDKYMPMDSSQMITSMYISTKIGSGEININTPYAHYQQEGVKYIDPKYKIGAFHDPISGRYHGGALRGDHFVERMLADHFEDILNAGQEEINK